MQEKTKFYSLEEIAEHFGVSYQLVYRMVTLIRLAVVFHGEELLFAEEI